MRGFQKVGVQVNLTWVISTKCSPLIPFRSSQLFQPFKSIFRGRETDYINGIPNSLTILAKCLGAHRYICETKNTGSGKSRNFTNQALFWEVFTVDLCNIYKLTSLNQHLYSRISLFCNFHMIYVLKFIQFLLFWV